MTTAGQLRERITFSRRADLSDSSPPGDGYGNFDGDWQDQFTVWARCAPARGAESIQAARLAGRQPVVITVWSSSDTRQVRPEWRATDARSGTIYNVRSIANPDERRQFLDMECDAGVAV